MMNRRWIVITFLIVTMLTTLAYAASPPSAPQWLEPSANKSDVDTVDFHIQVFPIDDPDNDAHIATDFEMWDVAANERIWSSLHNTNILYHIHNADGTFEGRLSGQSELEHERTYRLRARFYDDGPDNNVSPWSEWRYFSTVPDITFNDSEFTWTAREGYTIDLVARDISVPVNLEVAPSLYGHLPESEQPLLYLTQLYGKLGMVRDDGTYVLLADDLLNYASFGSLPGSGETGVTGLYADDLTGDLFVSMVRWDPSAERYWGKVERFALNADGDAIVSRTTILDNIPAAPSHQVQSITRGPDGKLYLNTGDADDITSADDPGALSGKILRFNDDGSMPADNPFPGTYVYATGFRNPFGAAWRPGTGNLFVTENGPDSDDAVKRVTPGGDHGWCCATWEQAWHHYEKTVAPVQLAFNPGTAGFPAETNGHLYVALSGSTYTQGPSTLSKRIAEFSFDPDGSEGTMQDLIVYTGDGYGAPIGLAFGEDGLYFSDIYGEEGFVGVGETRGNIFLVRPGQQTEDPLGGGDGEYRVSMGVGRWYPQGLDVVWECKPQNGEGPFLYDYVFGDGSRQTGTTQDNVYHTYPSEGTYDAGCTAHDQGTGLSASGSATITLGSGGGSVCGNGVVESGEACDDGNSVSGDGCSSTCEVESSDPVCGNGIVDSGEQCDDGNAVSGDGCSSSCHVESGACYGSVAEIPAECSGGAISQDSVSGVCRTVACGGLRVLACEKPDSGVKTYFEMYKQSSAEGVEVCLADTCIASNGYAKSPDYPICTDGGADDPVCGNGVVESGEACDDGNTQSGDGCSSTCEVESSDPVCGNGIVESGEQCDDGNAQSGDGCSSTCQIESGACFSAIDEIPAECTGGTVTQDSVSGVCRMVACGGLRVLACEKPDSGVKTYFEMYKQSSAEGVEVCLAGTCIAGNGYAKSPDYPICTGNETPDDPVCGNGVVESGEACDDGNTASGDGCSSTCQEEAAESSVELSIAPWYPQGRSYVFECDAAGIAPDSYDWRFGDGNKQIGTSSSDVYHTYAGPGAYTVECTARTATEVFTDSLAVEVQ